MFKYPLITTGFFLLLAHAPATAQRLVCEIPDSAPIANESVVSQLDNDDVNVFEFQAGEIDASFGDKPSVSMSGGVVVRRGNRLAGAENASYDPLTQALMLTGGVRYEGPDSSVTGRSAEFSYASGRIRFEGAEFQLGQNGGHGSAAVLELNQDGTLQLAEVGYTTCPPESNDWIIEAGEIELNSKTGVGKARHVKLRFQGVPILYTPYLSFPLSDARKSGVLAPEIGSTDRSGNEFSVPYYWNIRENYDATITPRLLTARGLQVGTEFRYLLDNSVGRARFEYLPDDDKFGDDRRMLAYEHQTLFGNGWRNLVEFNKVSDNQYFEDLGGSLSISSITHLDRSLLLDYHGDRWSLLGLVQEYQTIDDAIAPTDRPYQRLPQISATGYWPDGVLGMSYGFDSELVHFDRDVGVTGWRVNAAPRVELPISQAGWFIVPSLAFDYTRYDLEGTVPGQDQKPSRSLPISSIDAGLILERKLKTEGRIQTLEPRILYVNIPFRNQTDLPVFDTITPDLSLVQLYRKNRFLGVDRIADTDQLSIGITSRIMDSSSGRELMSATIGQALYLSNQGVSLPGQPIAIGDSSDYLAELSFLIYENLNFDIGHQWSNDNAGTTQSEARLQYRPRTNQILNLAYRYRKQSLEQGDVSWSWPLTKTWSFVGRYNYSFRDNRTLEQFFGLEYESCCWGIRFVSRRYISTRDGTKDSSFSLQLVLKGMMSVGRSADKLLEHGILGYSPNLY